MRKDSCIVSRLSPAEFRLWMQNFSETLNLRHVICSTRTLPTSTTSKMSPEWPKLDSDGDATFNLDNIRSTTNEVILAAIMRKLGRQEVHSVVRAEMCQLQAAGTPETPQSTNGGVYWQRQVGPPLSSNNINNNRINDKSSSSSYQTGPHLPQQPGTEEQQAFPQEDSGHEKAALGDPKIRQASYSTRIPPNSASSKVSQTEPRTYVYQGTTFYRDNFSYVSDEEFLAAVELLHGPHKFRSHKSTEKHQLHAADTPETVQSSSGRVHWQREVGPPLSSSYSNEDDNSSSSYQPGPHFPEQPGTEEQQAPPQEDSRRVEAAELQEWPPLLTLRAEDTQFPISGKFAVVLKDELKTRLQGMTLELPCKKVTLGHLVNFMKLMVTSPPEASDVGVTWTFNWKKRDGLQVYRSVRQAVLDFTKEEYHHHWPEEFPHKCFTPHYRW